MDNYSQNHIFFYQDLIHFSEDKNLRKLCIELRDLENIRLKYLPSDIETCSFHRDEDDKVRIFYLLYRVTFHLFRLKMNGDSGHELIVVEEEILHKIKSYLYVQGNRPPAYLFPKYCLERISAPLNDGLLIFVKILMTTAYFCMGWSKRLSKCIR